MPLHAEPLQRIHDCCHVIFLHEFFGACFIAAVTDLEVLFQWILID